MLRIFPNFRRRDRVTVSDALPWNLQLPKLARYKYPPYIYRLSLPDTLAYDGVHRKIMNLSKKKLTLASYLLLANRMTISDTIS